MGGKRNKNKHRANVKQLTKKKNKRFLDRLEGEEQDEDTFPRERHQRGHSSVLSRSRKQGTSVFSRLGGDSNRKHTNLWSKVIVENGPILSENCSDLWPQKTLVALEEFVGTNIMPLLCNFADGTLSFYVEDREFASSLGGASGRIDSLTRPGKKIKVKITQAPKNFTQLPERQENVIKQVLSSRFDASNAHIDLSNFASDSAFESFPSQLSLNRPEVISFVVKLLATDCPQLRSIDLTGNRLENIDWLSTLVFKTPNVHRLLLAHNELPVTHCLYKVRAWTINELDLNENPLIARFNKPQHYITTIRRILPEVQKLDDVDIAASNSETPDSGQDNLPKFKPGFYVNEQIRGLIESFVCEYFSLYDGPTPMESRKQLLAAYEQNATFTMVAEKLYNDTHHDSSLSAEYRVSSHNIENQPVWHQFRSKMVHCGALEVVAALCKLPITQHLPQSFIIDVSLATDSVLLFTVSGLLRDGKMAGTETQKFSFFTRSFLCAKKGEGKLAAVNDQLFMSPFNGSRAEKYIQSIQELCNDGNNEQIHKESLIKRFCAESGMNRSWAQKCLEDNNWDLESAAQAFIALNKEGKVPTQAFE